MGLQSWVRMVTSRLVIAGLAAAELLFTTLSTAAESDIMGVILAAVSLLGIELDLVATGAGILFFGYATYVAVPRIFPTELDGVSQRTDFRVLGAIAAVGTGKLFTGYLIPADLVHKSSEEAMFLSSILFLWVIFQVSITIVFVITLDYRGVIQVGPIARALSKRLGVEYETPGKVKDALFLGVWLGGAFLFLGMLVGGAVLLYPVPEIAAILWPVAAGFGLFPSQNFIRFDIEEKSFDLVAGISQSDKGLSVSLLVITGFGLGASFFGVAFFQYVDYLKFTLGVSGARSVDSWNAFGGCISMGVAALFAVWFWINIIRRLSASLRAWNEAYIGLANDEKQQVCVTRPIGLLIPFSAAVLPANIYMQATPFGRVDGLYFGAQTVVQTTYGVVWPLSLVLLGWAVYRTRQREPQPPISDIRVLPIAYVVSVSPVYIGPLISGFLARIAGTAPPRRWIVSGGLTLLFLLVYMIFQYYLPNLRYRQQNHANGWRAYQHHIGFLIIGGFGIFGALLGTGVIQLVGGILGVSFIGSVIVSFYRNEL